jgi:hypothetical protein
VKRSAGPASGLPRVAVNQDGSRRQLVNQLFWMYVDVSEMCRRRGNELAGLSYHCAARQWVEKQTEQSVKRHLIQLCNGLRKLATSDVYGGPL